MKSNRYEYSCAACGGQVVKQAQCHSKKDEDGHRVDYAGLHGWQCSNCGSGIKVKRILKGN